MSASSTSILLATASYDRQIKLWRVNPVEQFRSFNFAPESHVNCLAISPDRTRLAAAGYTTLKVYDLAALTGDGSHAQARDYAQSVVSQSQDSSHTANITAVCFVRSSQGAHQLVSTSEDGTWKLWDTRAPALRLKRAVDVKEPLNAGVLLRNVLVCGTQLGTIGLWSLGAQHAAGQAAAAAAGGSAAAPAANGGASPDGLIDSVSLQSDDPAVRTVCLSPGGEMVIAGSNSGRIYAFAVSKSVFGGATRQTSSEADADNSQQQAGEAAAASDSRPAASPSMSGLGVPNASVLTSNDAKATGAAGSGSNLVRGGNGSLILIWSFEAHPRYILKAAISPNGALLCTTSADCMVSLWRVPTELPALCEEASVSGSSTVEPRTDKWVSARNIAGHQRWVWDCAFSRCSSYVVTASSDHTGRLWNVELGRLEATFTGHSKPVTCVVLDDRRE